MTTASGPNPLPIFNAFNAHTHTGVFIAAIDLDVFTKIGEGASTVAQIAQKTSASERGIRTLCDALVVMGLLRKSGSDYSLTEDAAVFLDRRSPASLASAAPFLHGKWLVEAFEHFTEAVRKGGTALPGAGSVEPDNPICVDFARGMMPMMMPAAQHIAEVLKAKEGKSWKVLDIAAGHGIFGITLAQQNPNAKIVAVDWKAVLKVAKEHAQRFGVADRLATIPGSAFDVDFGKDYDVALITNFLHHFDEATCTSFLKKVHAALKPGGVAVTLEFVPNEDRVSPASAAWFSTIMLATTRSGDAYTFNDLKRMYEAAGFKDVSLHRFDPMPHSIVLGKK